MVDDALVEAVAFTSSLPWRDQLLHQLGGVDHLVVAAELRELVLDVLKQCGQLTMTFFTL